MATFIEINSWIVRKEREWRNRKEDKDWAGMFHFLSSLFPEAILTNVIGRHNLSWRLKTLEEIWDFSLYKTFLSTPSGLFAAVTCHTVRPIWGDSAWRWVQEVYKYMYIYDLFYNALC